MMSSHASASTWPCFSAWIRRVQSVLRFRVYSVDNDRTTLQNTLLEAFHFSSTRQLRSVGSPSQRPPLRVPLLYLRVPLLSVVPKTRTSLLCPIVRSDSAQIENMVKSEASELWRFGVYTCLQSRQTPGRHRDRMWLRMWTLQQTPLKCASASWWDCLSNGFLPSLSSFMSRTIETMRKEAPRQVGTRRKM